MAEIRIPLTLEERQRLNAKTALLGTTVRQYVADLVRRDLDAVKAALANQPTSQER